MNYLEIKKAARFVPRFINCSKDRKRHASWRGGEREHKLENESERESKRERERESLICKKTTGRGSVVS